MSDQWNNPLEPEQNTEPFPVTVQPVAPASEPTSEPEQPVAPASEPTPKPEPEPPAAPQTPYNGWSSDGSYRYVPPRTEQSSTPPTQPSYQPSGYTPYTPPTPPKPPRKKGNNGFVVVLAILCAVAVVASIVFLGLGLLSDRPDVSPDVSGPTESSGEIVDTNAPSLEISDWDDNDGGLSNKEIVNRNFNATVVITTYMKSTSFNFGESELVEAGGASGIVMSEDGYIITNWHCVINENTGEAYDRVDVTTYDGKTYESARVIGSDESTDLAVIKIDAKGLTAAQFGDSSSLAVGDRVVALGNAAGLSWTATFGYVSALARDVYDDTGYAIKCLQVDAAINPGNSGGPLLNNQGLVVGINSAKIAATGYEGLGFSIPINEAKGVLDALLKYGYVKGRVALGVMGQTVSSGMYNGFLITSIEEGSCFEDTNVAAGDLIVAVDDVDVTNYGELRAELAKHKVGDRVTVTLLRSNRNGRVTSFEVTVTLKEQKAAN